MNKRKWWCIMAAAAMGIIGCSAVQKMGDSMGGQMGGVISGAAQSGKALTLNEHDEQVIGRSLAISITNKYPLSEDRRLLTYVNYVGQTLVSVSSKPDRHYVFGVLDTDEIGAFSAPDGYIFVTRGAVAFAQDEAELAGVIGHELTHVIRQHGLKAVKATMLKTGVIHGAAAGAKIDDALPALDAAGDVILIKGYDKSQEFEADAGSIKLLLAAGYDPHGLLNYLKRLDAKQSSANGGGLMSTHPGTHERIAKVAKKIQEDGASGGATLTQRFRDHVMTHSAMAQ